MNLLALCVSQSLLLLVSDDFVQLIVDASCEFPDVVSDNQRSSVNASAVSVNGGSDELLTSANIIDDLSSLSYMDVSIRCNANEICKPVKALCDSGSEMSRAKSELLNNFDCHVVGKVQLKPFTGDSISADVVRVNTANGCNCDFDAGIYMHCAMVADLNDEMILAENAIARLLQNGFEQ